VSDSQDRGADSLGARSNSSVRSFALGAHGLRRILGATEVDLMQALWALTCGSEDTSKGWTTIGAVCQSLGPGHNYKTVQTVMNRLVEKRLVLRREEAPAYLYRPAITREDLIAQVTRQVIDGLMQDFGDIAVAQLAHALQNVSPQSVALLEELAEEERANAPSSASMDHAKDVTDEDE
jgi:predicted transcriptional regulator